MGLMSVLVSMSVEFRVGPLCHVHMWELQIHICTHTLQVYMRNVLWLLFGVVVR